ncbi:MAG TPA: hypothetical protein VHW01_13875, partial [Polyangiaceae bacterium]|nr:hypothetical protein [Polyangiaceae bacterium]
WARKLELEPLQQFLGRVDVYQDTLQSYPSRDNSILFACVDELVERVARGEARPVRLDADAPGKFTAEV